MKANIIGGLAKSQHPRSRHLLIAYWNVCNSPEGQTEDLETKHCYDSTASCADVKGSVNFAGERKHLSACGALDIISRIGSESRLVAKV
jgi:hypothetical protein